MLKLTISLLTKQSKYSSKKIEMLKLNGFTPKEGSKTVMKDKSKKKSESFLKCYTGKRSKSCTFITTDAKCMETFFLEMTCGKYTNLTNNGLLSSTISSISETIWWTSFTVSRKCLSSKTWFKKPPIFNNSVISRISKTLSFSTTKWEKRKTSETKSSLKSEVKGSING